MKKILAFLLAALMLTALFVVPSSAASTVNDKLDAEFIKTAPKQDGKIGSSEYGLFPALTYSKDKDKRFQAADDNDDYNDWDFDFYIAWDEKNLYMAWDVKSKVHQPMKKATYDDDCNIVSNDWPEDGSMLGHMWWQSCIQLMITPGNPTKGNYDGNYLEVGFCQMDDGDVGRVAWAYPKGVSADKISLNDWSAEVVRTGDHTIYEIAIPWTMSGIKEAGTDKQFGLTFAVAAQEDYNKVKKGMIEWNDAMLGYPNGKQPNKAGVITLKGGDVVIDTGSDVLEPGVIPEEAQGKVQLYIDFINEKLAAETIALQTDGKSEINTNWAYALLLRPVEGKENVYSIIAKAQGEGTGDVKFDDYKKGDLVLGIHSDCQDPAKGADYAGYEEKNAAVNILAEGDELTLFGVDVKNGKLTYSNAMFYCVAKDAAVSEPTDDSSDASIEESSIEESSEEESSEEEKTSAPAAESSEADDKDGGFPVWAIILIIVAVVAVIAVVVVIVLKKKK